MHNKYTEVDPMSLMLPGDIYAKWCEIRYPRFRDFQKEINILIRDLTKDQREETLARARSLISYGKLLVDYGKAMEKVISEEKIKTN